MILKRIKKKIVRMLKGRNVPSLVKKTYSGRRVATHISAFSWGNAGDTLLPVVLRDLFSGYAQVGKWHSQHVYKIVDDKDVHRINNDDFVIIGGGGLFLCDTNRNDLSGWQWSCSLDMLDKIEKPLVGFAIGYNRFRGQEEFQPIFTEHLNFFVKKAVFVGIRNHGSIECLKHYLSTEELRNKLTYQPCMTTLISHIYPNLFDYHKKEDFIAFNCAFDRQSLRSQDDGYLKAIAQVALELSKMSEIRYYSHMATDEQALPYFDEVGVPYKLVRFGTVKEIVQEYAKPRLVIGMRGHAQMIPFGCLTPILSIVSHDKMQWFLDDIHHSEWGADVQDVMFEEKLLEKAKSLYEKTEDIVKEIWKQQNRLWNITMENMKHIDSAIERSSPPECRNEIKNNRTLVININCRAAA